MRRHLLLAVLFVCALHPSARAQTLANPTPGALTSGVSVVHDRVTLTWGAVPSATWYRVWVDHTETDPSGATTFLSHVFDQRYTASDAGCGEGQGQCTVVAPLAVRMAQITWYLQAWSPTSVTLWSRPQNVVVTGRIFARPGIVGSTNIAVGPNALASAQVGLLVSGGNVAVGEKTMELASNNTSQNTAIGNTALQELRGLSGFEARSNTAVGFHALGNALHGSQNIGIGAEAGVTIEGTSSNNIYVGFRGVSNDENNTIRIGQADANSGAIPHSSTFLAGVFGVTSAAGNAVFINGAGQLGTISSSRRFKTNIREVGAASEAVLRLRPVAFEYTSNLDPAGLQQYGLVAEEVEVVMPELVLRDKDGKPESVRYHLLVPLLLKELQKQRDINDEQAQRLTDLSMQMDALMRGQTTGTGKRDSR